MNTQNALERSNKTVFLVKNRGYKTKMHGKRHHREVVETIKVCGFCNVYTK